MNKWECERHGCDVTAIGLGGAIGLRAIGWWFVPGRGLLCPVHRPDPTPCDQVGNEENKGNECTLCTADAEARKHQEHIRLEVQ